ncbi:MAG TPA: nucleotidyltransferase domain-containing protein [Candidatus Nanoarchaeia archaeon]|nr:nucleotidyltransferase domain-containing protein [Candidatus Nanoarchaeia archaeon]
MKRAENLKLLYESGLVKFLYDALPGATIILFGSFASGDDTFSSDIDLAIIGVKEKNLNLANYQKMLEKSINLNYYPSLSLEKHLKNNLLNGIVLKGSIEL